MFTALPEAGSGLSHAAMAHPEFPQNNGLVQYGSCVRNDGGPLGSLQSVRLEKVVSTAP